MIRRVVLSLVLLVLASGSVPARDAEPESGGKTLSAWSEALTRKGATKAERRDAAWALYMIGPKAVPALVAALANDDAQTRVNASLVLELLGTDAVPGLAKALKSKNPEQKAFALRAVGRIGYRGHNAEAAVPALLELLADKDASAFNVLSLLGPSAKGAIPALTKLLGDDDTGWKNTPQTGPYTTPPHLAGGTLHHIGVTGAQALLDALKHRDALVRRTAAQWLEIMLQIRYDEYHLHRVNRLALTDWLRGSGADSRAARQALAKALSDDDEDVGYNAAHVLASCGPAAKDVVPALLAAVENPKNAKPSTPNDWVRVRTAAAETLGYIGPGAKEAIPALTKALRDRDEKHRRAAEIALSLIAPNNQFAEWLVIGMNESVKLRGERENSVVLGFSSGERKLDENETRRIDELNRWLSGKNPKVVPTLTAALKKHAELEVRLKAADALRAFAYEPIFHDSYPYRGMTEEGWFVLNRWQRADRARAGRTPDKLPAEIIPALIEALGDKNPAIRTAAADALALIGSEAKAAVPALLKIVEERAGQERAAAIVALWAVGADAKLAVPLLNDAIRASEKEVRDAAAVALARLDPKPERAKQFADVLLTSDLKGIQLFAAGELIALGPKAKDALPRLVGSFANNSGPMLEPTSVSETLVRFGGVAVPALVAGLKDQNVNVRRAAAWVLGMIGPKAKDAVEPLAAALNDEELTVRVTAARALLQIDPDAARKLGLR